MILYHTVACTKTKCDPPRVVKDGTGRRDGVPLPGCPIGDPRVPGGVLAADDVAVIPQVAD